MGRKTRRVTRRPLMSTGLSLHSDTPRFCCVVCCTYRNAKHAAKQRKKDAFELETLKAAEREAGRGGDAGGLGGIGSASMRADEVYIEASRV